MVIEEKGREERDEERGGGGGQTKNFMVVLLEHHFHIQTDEFSHVTVSVGVLGTENGSDLENFLEISVDSHLFVKLKVERSMRENRAKDNKEERE